MAASIAVTVASVLALPMVHRAVMFVETPPVDQPPVVSLISPSNQSEIDPNTPVVLDITDDSGLFRRILLVLRLAGTDEVIHNGEVFSPPYTSAPNLRSGITNGYRFTLLRRGGWPSNPTLVPYVLDQTGNENQ